MAKRPWYKRERAPARVKSELQKMAPVGCPNATKREIGAALTALCSLSGLLPGRGAEYDAIKDVYTITGKRKDTGKAVDAQVQGEIVATLVDLQRLALGQKPWDESVARRHSGALTAMMLQTVVNGRPVRVPRGM